MPLTNVWTRDTNGEWIRTSASEIDRGVSYSVSVDSRLFRCYSCFQYVTFIKGSINRVSHFKHSARYSDKDCEDRSSNISTDHLYENTSSVDMPMRLVLDSSRLTVSIGLLPVGYNELERCIANNLRITLSGSQGIPVVYCVDHTRFAPNITTWLDVPTSGIARLKADFSPASIKPKVWSGLPVDIPETGALFDAKTYLRIPDKGDAVVNREYFLLLKRNKEIRYNSNDIQVTKQNTTDTFWNVYKIQALRFSEAASDFFFNYPRVRLTNHPAEMSVIWPPVLEKDKIIETNCRNIALVMKGEADFSVYPRSTCLISELGRNTRLMSIQSFGPLQMITSERYNHTLQFWYVRPIEREFYYSNPRVDVYFDDEQPCTDTQLKSVPIRGILHFLSTDDGYIDVYENEEFCYRRKLPACEKTRITEIKHNSRICVYIGLDLTTEITIAALVQKNKTIQYNNLPAWRGRKIPFPRKYAWVLTVMDKQSELYLRTLHALRQDRIPQDGWNTIQMVMEEHQNVFG